MLPITLAGLKGEYVLQGELASFYAYSIDWEAGTASDAKTLSLTTDPNLIWDCRIQGDWTTHNAILTSKAVFRVNAKPGDPINQEKYPVPEGHLYSYPQVAHLTNFMFVATYDFPSGQNKLYRLHSDKITDFKEFTISDNSRAFGVLDGSPWLLVSPMSGTDRKLFDYTNGFDGGTNTATSTHTKTGDAAEMSFMSPMDKRGFYVVGKLNSWAIYTVKDQDGSEKLNYDLTPEGFNSYLNAISWVPDTDLCFLVAFNKMLALVDFMDEAKTRALTKVDLGDQAYQNYNGMVWLDKRAAIVGMNLPNQAFVYKISEADQPCAELCKTCHIALRTKCLSCRPNSSLATGDV